MQGVDDEYANRFVCELDLEEKTGSFENNSDNTILSMSAVNSM